MAGGGGDRGQQPSRGGRREHRQKAAWLPLDVIAEIAARSDPATLVRCAATCRDARRRIAEDPSLLGRLRLRATERFVLPLLRGHITYTGAENTNVYLVDTTTAADATRLVKTTFFAEADERLSNVVPVDSRGGLVLVRATTTAAQDQRKLLVCNLATGRCQALPPEPVFPDDVGSTGLQYVLLVGNRDDEGAGSDAVGRPFQVLKSRLVLSEYRSYRRLAVHTFSSEHGAWSPLTVIPTPNLLGSGKRCKRPLVVGDAVHWLCLTKSGSYMLILHVGTARVNVTSLPAGFPRDDGKNSHAYDVDEGHKYLLATATAGGNPVVLVADTDRISAWEQSKHTKLWKPRPPQVVIEREAVVRFNDEVATAVERVEREERWRWTTKHAYVPELLWFGERSGVVLLRTHGRCLLWLDLHSKKIVRCFCSDRRMQGGAQVPYEVDLSSWVPTFGSAVTL